MTQLSIPITQQIQERWKNPNSKALLLAPMEGITDDLMRDFLTHYQPNYIACFTEFLRVSNQPLPRKAILKRLPELRDARGYTPNGVPIVLQLLGGDPERLAKTAENALVLGVHGIDLNFGCPAPLVNRHDGGASLLKDLPRLEKIISSVRTVVTSPKVSFSVKMRLGWDNDLTCIEAAKRAQNAGADFITVHARNKMQLYGPPVKWEILKLVRNSVQIPVFASGDLWSIENIEKCADQTNLNCFMIARGALARPRIEQSSNTFPLDFIISLVKLAKIREIKNPIILKKLKQICHYARMGGTLRFFDQIKRIEDVEQFLEIFEKHSGAYS